MQEKNEPIISGLGTNEPWNKKPLPALNIIIGVLFFVFCFLLFKNISYPLLWNDESETAMFAQQILRYGYPKCHDGKNFILMPADQTLIGYKPSYDALIAIPWGSYYFAVIGVFLSNGVNDIYLKSALVRLPFAIMGLTGIIIFILSIKGLFPNRRSYQWATVVFFLAECFSVALFLNIRTARYYSLVIFIVSCFFYLFIRYFIHKKTSQGRYILFMAVILFFAYQINVPTFIICCLTIALYEARYILPEIFAGFKQGQQTKAIFQQHIKRILISAAPILITIVLITPFVIFFETFSTIARTSVKFAVSNRLYGSHLKSIFLIFESQELLLPVIFVGIVKEAFVLKYRGKDAPDKKISGQEELKKASFFMALFFICFCVIISRMPFFFTRYFIVLQPVMIMLMLVNAIIILNYMSVNLTKATINQAQVGFVIVLGLILIFNSKKKIEDFKGYAYEVTHQYKGSLDYLIPYIQNKYQRTDTLILATNFEELSYIYYLNCKVTIGFAFKDRKDFQIQPDAIIFRKSLNRSSIKHGAGVFDQVRKRAVYERTTFPVREYAMNTISELDTLYSWMEHHFKTVLTDKDSLKTDIYTRVQ